jgi:hypothetical protein
MLIKEPVESMPRSSPSTTHKIYQLQFATRFRHKQGNLLRKFLAMACHGNY